MHAPSEERTAHHVRRLHESVRDLQSALANLAKSERPPRPLAAQLTPDTPAAENPYGRISANNERGVVQHIERIRTHGAAVLGLQGVGALISDALCRYGIKRLVLGDGAEIGVGDLDFMGFSVEDVGKMRDDHVATTSRSLNPDTDVFALGVSLSDTPLVVEALRRMLAPASSSGLEDVRADNNVSGGSDGDSDASSDDDDASAPYRSEIIAPESDELDDELCFDVVFVCGSFPELALTVNELCCEYGVQLIYVRMGRNGISGDIISVVPGRSACLQCLEKRKVVKLSTTSSTDNDSSSKPPYSATLPMTECVLAGVATQHAFSHLVSAGPLSSRVEYDGVLEELDRSGFIAPVHQCPSIYCRRQQQRHHNAQQPSPSPAVMSRSEPQVN